MKYFAIFFTFILFASVFFIPADASLIKFIKLEKDSLMYGESFQYTITRTQIGGEGGEQLQTRIINKADGTASDWSSETLEGDRDTIITSKILGHPFEKKGDYILEVKYPQQNSGFISYGEFKLLDDADTTNLQGKSHLLSPNEQRFAGFSIQEIKCNQGLELIKKPSMEMPACVKPDSVQKLVERGWISQFS